MIQGDNEAIFLKHRPWNITASTPNAIANYLYWAQFSLRFWHFWWVSSPFQWFPTISKPVLSISLIVGRLCIRISLTTRENALVTRDGEGFMEVAMLLHVLVFWGLLARPAGRSDWPVEIYPVRTSRVMRKAGAAKRRLAEKLGRNEVMANVSCCVNFSDVQIMPCVPNLILVLARFLRMQEIQYDKLDAFGIVCMY